MYYFGTLLGQIKLIIGIASPARIHFFPARTYLKIWLLTSEKMCPVLALWKPHTME